MTHTVSVRLTRHGTCLSLVPGLIRTDSVQILQCSRTAPVQSWPDGACTILQPTINKCRLTDTYDIVAPCRTIDGGRWCAWIGLMKMTVAMATWLFLISAQLQSLVPACRADSDSETSVLAGNQQLRAAWEVRCQLLNDNNGSRNDLEYGDLKQRELDRENRARRGDLAVGTVAEREPEEKGQKRRKSSSLARKRTSPQQWYNIDGAWSWLDAAPPASSNQRRGSDRDARPAALFQQASSDVVKRFVEQNANNNDDLLAWLVKRRYQPTSAWPTSHVRIWGKRKRSSLPLEQLGDQASSRNDDSRRKGGKNAHDLVRIWG